MPPFMKWLSLLPVLFIAVYQAQASGFGINATRLIYPENESSIHLTLRNTESSTPYLVQSTVSSRQDTLLAAPFTVTPPLFRLEPGNVNQLRISFNGTALPRDRESVFYFHARAIPAGNQANAGKQVSGIQGQVRFGVGNIIKLFYRPTGLQGNPKDAQKGLQFARVKDGLKVTNPSPYYVSLGMLTVDGKKMVLDTPSALMLAPGGSHIWKVTAANKIEWKTINDSGGTYAFSATLYE